MTQERQSLSMTFIATNSRDSRMVPTLCVETYLHVFKGDLSF